MKVGGPPGGKKGTEKKYKASFLFKYNENGTTHYWVTAFSGDLIAAGFAITVLHDFGCVVSELHSYQPANNLRCFTLIVPEDKHQAFVQWLKKTIKLKFEIKK